MGWLADWSYRKSHTLTGSSIGAQTDYQVGIKVYYGAGTDGTEAVRGTTFGKIYCNSKCKTDFGDIRFTKSDGISPLDYWIEAKVDGNYAIIWVKVDAIPEDPGTKIIYVYYGNDAVSTTSSGTSTFIYFNDFVDDPTITAKNYEVNTWYHYFDIPDMDGENVAFDWSFLLTVSVTHQFGTYVFMGPRDNVGVSGGGCHTEVFGPAVAADTGHNPLRNLGHVYYGTTDWSGSALDLSKIYHVENVFDGNNTNILGVYNPDNTLFRSNSEAVTPTYAIIVFQASGGKYSETTHTCVHDAVNDRLNFEYRAATGSRLAGWVDTLRIRKWVNPNPTHTSWGLAETFVDLPAQFEVAQGAVELHGQFEVGQGAVELHGQFEVGQGAVELHGEFIVQHEASVELLGEFNIRHDASADLFAEFEVGQGSADLYAEFIAQHETSVDLHAAFEGQVTENLLGEFIVKNAGAEDLLGEFIVKNEASADLLAGFMLPIYQELFAKFVIIRSGPVPWLAGWRYRKLHALAGSTAGVLTNYQMGVKVYYGAGADGTEVIGGVTFGKVYCDSKCQTDFEDIRFTNRDGTTLLDYWLQEKIDSDYAIFWVEVDSIPVSPNTVNIYIYYGNASATYTDAQQHGKDTFIAFDDFPGSALDGQWTVDANITVTVAGGRLTCKSTASAWSTWHGIHMAVANVQGIRLESYVADWDHVSSDLFQYGQVLGVSLVDIPLGHRLTDSHAATSECYLNYYYDSASLAKGDIQGQEPVDLISQRDQNGVAKFFKDGVEQGVGGETSTDAFDTLMILCNRHTTRICPNLYLDRILARSFVDPEPTHSVWGTETEVSLFAKFNVTQTDTVNLYAEFTVGVDQGAEDLLAEFSVRQETSVDLLGEFIVRQETSEDLLGEFVVRQEVAVDLLAGFSIGRSASTDLLAEFYVRNAGTEDLLCKTEIKNIGSADLLGKFEAQATADLLGKFEAQATAELLGRVDIQQSGSAELLGNLDVQRSGSAELLGKFDVQVTQSGSAELLGKAVIRELSSADLLGRAEVQRSGSAELLGRAEVQQLGLAELLGKADIQLPDSAELLGKTRIRHMGISVELLGGFVVRHVGAPVNLLGRAIIENISSAELLGKAEIQQSGSAELLGRAEVRQPDSAELLSKAVIRHVGTPVELLGRAVIRQPRSAELLGRGIIRNVDSAELLGRAVIRQPGSAELLGNLDVQRSGSAELLGKFDVQVTQSGSAELLGNARIQHVGISVEFLGGFVVRHVGAVDLLGRTIIRHSASSDLKLSFYVSPWYLTAVEMLIGGRDRLMDLGGLDREMLIGGRDRRMDLGGLDRKMVVGGKDRRMKIK